MILSLKQRKLLLLKVKKYLSKPTYNDSSRLTQRSFAQYLNYRYYSCKIQTEIDNIDKRKINIIGMTKDEIKEEFKHFGIETYRADQVWHWLYNIGVTSFDEMLNINKSLRQSLNEKYYISYGKVSSDLLSSDGTRKWLFDYENEQVESVFIPESRRGTLCVSSQVGCTMSCKFCHTGTQPLVRNLTASEIVGQLMNAKKLLYDFPRRKERIVSNIVFMGQGEPFYNYRNVKKALSVFLDHTGIGISSRRITVSTSGIVPVIKKFGNDFPSMNLAISLHAVTDELRDEIVPANKQWPIAELMDACRNYPNLSPFKRITFEYVMLKGINDSLADAKELVRLIKDIHSIVNIIPFNPWPGSIYESSSDDTIIEFARYIENSGINAPIRWPRGRDILAACGQLKSESTKKKKEELFS